MMLPVLKVTCLSSRTDTEGRREEWTVEQLASKLSECRRLPRTAKEYFSLDSAGRHFVKDGPAWVPGWFDSKRTDDTMGDVHALVLDFDALRDVDALWEAIDGLCYVAHTSASHTPDRPKWRVVFPLGTPVRPAEWRPFWEDVVAWLGLVGHLEPDKAARNPSRLYYLPTRLAGVNAGLRYHSWDARLCEDGVWRNRPLLFPMDVPARGEPPKVARKAPDLRWESDKFKRAAASYLKKMGGAVEGAGGDDKTYQAAAICRDFGLSDADAMDVLLAWNASCSPPWTEEALRAKWMHVNRYAKNEAGWRRTADIRGGNVDGAAWSAYMDSLRRRE